MSNLNETAEQKRLNEAREQRSRGRSGIPTCPSATGGPYARITATMATRGTTSATIKHVHAPTIGAKMAWHAFPTRSAALLCARPVEWARSHS
jgi:hypothetical protein